MVPFLLLLSLPSSLTQMRFHNPSFQRCLVNILPPPSCCHLSESAWPKSNYECISIPAQCLHLRCLQLLEKNLTTRCTGTIINHTTELKRVTNLYWTLGTITESFISAVTSISHIPFSSNFWSSSLLPHSQNLIFPITWLRKYQSLYNNSLNFQSPNPKPTCVYTHPLHAYTHPLLLSSFCTGRDTPLPVSWKLCHWKPWRINYSLSVLHL